MNAYGINAIGTPCTHAWKSTSKNLWREESLCTYVLQQKIYDEERDTDNFYIHHEQDANMFFII